MGQKIMTLKIKERLTQLLAGDGKVKLIVLLGVCGIALILLSDILPTSKGQGGSEAQSTQKNAAAIGVNAEQVLEEKLYAIIASIEGVGKAKVMVTFENGTEYVYANAEKKNTDVTQDFNEKEIKKLHEKDTSESSYILVDNGKGKEALVTTRIEPKVRGVVVVCEGAEDILVEERLISAVTTAMAISSTQVCIAKMAT